MLGVRFVDGTGSVIANGGRVMKNVTGYDLVKLMCGSYGTLGVISEISFKVLPRAANTMTLVLEGLDDATATAVMADAVTRPYDVTGAAHLPGDGGGRTAIRVEGMAEQSGYRADRLAKHLGRHGEVRRIEGDEHRALWSSIRDCKAFAGQPGAVWRISVRPSHGAAVVAAIRSHLDASALYDWAGGLVWLLVPEADDAGAETVRAAVSEHGGHATLIRAPAAIRTAVPVFEPEPAPLARISDGLRARFDPGAILNPNRMSA